MEWYGRFDQEDSSLRGVQESLRENYVRLGRVDALLRYYAPFLHASLVAAGKG